MGSIGEIVRLLLIDKTDIQQVLNGQLRKTFDEERGGIENFFLLDG